MALKYMTYFVQPWKISLFCLAHLYKKQNHACDACDLINWSSITRKYMSRKNINCFFRVIIDNLFFKSCTWMYIIMISVWNLKTTLRKFCEMWMSLLQWYISIHLLNILIYYKIRWSNFSSLLLLFNTIYLKGVFANYFKIYKRNNFSLF